MNYTPMERSRWRAKGREIVRVIVAVSQMRKLGIDPFAPGVKLTVLSRRRAP